MVVITIRSCWCFEATWQETSQFAPKLGCSLKTVAGSKSIFALEVTLKNIAHWIFCQRFLRFSSTKYVQCIKIHQNPLREFPRKSTWAIQPYHPNGLLAAWTSHQGQRVALFLTLSIHLATTTFQKLQRNRRDELMNWWVVEKMPQKCQPF